MLLTLFGISIVIFALLRIVPGNIADILFSSAGMINPADKAQIEKDLGLDQPIVIQYAQWIGGVIHRGLRYLYIFQQPNPQEIAPPPPLTAELARLALRFAVLVRIPPRGVLAGRPST